LAAGSGVGRDSAFEHLLARIRQFPAIPLQQLADSGGQCSLLRKPLHDHQPGGHRQNENAAVLDNLQILLQQGEEARRQDFAEPSEDLLPKRLPRNRLSGGREDFVMCSPIHQLIAGLSGIAPGPLKQFNIFLFYQQHRHPESYKI
jgi:hypothetical protein